MTKLQQACSKYSSIPEMLWERMGMGNYHAQAFVDMAASHSGNRAVDSFVILTRKVMGIRKFSCAHKHAASVAKYCNLAAVRLAMQGTVWDAANMFSAPHAFFTEAVQPKTWDTLEGMNSKYVSLLWLCSSWQRLQKH